MIKLSFVVFIFMGDSPALNFMCRLFGTMFVPPMKIEQTEGPKRRDIKSGAEESLKIKNTTFTTGRKFEIKKLIIV